MATQLRGARTSGMNEEAVRRVSLVLLLLRIGIFMMMMVWAIDKFVRPQHASAVFDLFYNIDGVAHTLVYLIGAVQVAIFIGFLLGYRKRLTYGLVLLIHTFSTLVAFPIYLAPYSSDPNSPNILFWAAWPVLAACFGLYYLRDLDTRLTIDQ